MTFKGTTRIGSVNAKKEEALLDSLDEGARPHVRFVPGKSFAGSATSAQLVLGIERGPHHGVLWLTPAHADEVKPPTGEKLPTQSDALTSRRRQLWPALILRRRSAVFYSMQDARAAGATKEVARLSQQMPRLQAAAEALVVPNAFGALLQQEGALNLNATTSHVRHCNYLTDRCPWSRHGACSRTRARHCRWCRCPLGAAILEYELISGQPDATSD